MFSYEVEASLLRAELFPSDVESLNHLHTHNQHARPLSSVYAPYTSGGGGGGNVLAHSSGLYHLWICIY